MIQTNPTMGGSTSTFDPTAKRIVVADELGYCWGVRRAIDIITEAAEAEGILADARTLEEAGAATLAFIREHVPQARTVPLCGNSIGMDRRFLAAYLPEIEEYLHYRSVDVSTIKELARRWYPDALAAAPRKATTHRALDDIRESVAELRYWREHVFTQTGAPAPGTAENP